MDHQESMVTVKKTKQTAGKRTGGSPPPRTRLTSPGVEPAPATLPTATPSSASPAGAAAAAASTTATNGGTNGASTVPTNSSTDASNPTNGGAPAAAAAAAGSAGGGHLMRRGHKLHTGSPYAKSGIKEEGQELFESLLEFIVGEEEEICKRYNIRQEFVDQRSLMQQYWCKWKHF